MKARIALAYALLGGSPRSRSLDTALLGISQLRAGLSTLVGQQLVLMGTFFVIPVYLQAVLGLDAFDTGKRLLPLSVAMLVFAPLGPRIAARRSPRTVAQIGLVAVSIGALVMLATLDVTLNDTGFTVALGLVGAGAGLLASQRGNVIMSSVAPTQTSEAGGLQGTAQNLGASLGTAIIGAVLLASLATGFSERITNNPDVPPAARDDRRQHPRGDRDCAGGGGRAGRRGRWAHAGPGPRGRRRLRRGATRRAAALARRGRARGAAIAMAHATNTDTNAR
jgi:Major Facilitator Superfamily